MKTYAKDAKVFYIQIWTERDIIRAWFVAADADEAFDMAATKYEGSYRFSVIYVYNLDEVSFYVCTLRGTVSSVDVYRYGNSKRGYIRRSYSGDDSELENVSDFIAMAVNRGAECIVDDALNRFE